MNQVEPTIRKIAKLIKISYEEYDEALIHKNALNTSKIALPKTIRDEIFKLAKKYGAVFYGSFVSANQIRMRKTSDFDMYLPESKMNAFLDAVRKKFPKTTLSLNAFGMWKIKINNKEIADVGYLEQIKKNKDGTYTIVPHPLNLKSKFHPVTRYNKVKARTMVVEHLSKANASLIDTIEHKNNRYAKDVYDFGVMNRNLVSQLFKKYAEHPDKKLNKIINDLVREIVLYSSDKNVMPARSELERQLIRNNMVTFKLFDISKNHELLKYKKLLENPKYDVTKNFKFVEYFKPKTITHK